MRIVNITDNKSYTAQFVTCPNGVGEMQTTPIISIYPNPTTGDMRIESEEQKIKNVEIFDAYGKNVGVNMQIRPENSENKIVINISHLSAGVYFVKISTEMGEVIKKVLKE